MQGISGTAPSFNVPQLTALQDGARVFQDKQGHLWIQPKEPNDKFPHLVGCNDPRSLPPDRVELRQGQILSALMKSSGGSRFQELKNEFKAQAHDSKPAEAGFQRVVTSLLKSARLPPPVAGDDLKSLSVSAGVADKLDGKDRGPSQERGVEKKGASIGPSSTAPYSRLNLPAQIGVRFALRALAIDFNQLPTSDCDALVARAKALILDANPNLGMRGDVPDEILKSVGQKVAKDFCDAPSNSLDGIQSDSLLKEFRNQRLETFTSALKAQFGALEILESHKHDLQRLTDEFDRTWLAQHGDAPAALTLSKEQAAQLAHAAISKLEI